MRKCTTATLLIKLPCLFLMGFHILYKQGFSLRYLDELPYSVFPSICFLIPRLICSVLGAGERESRSASPTEEMKAITLHPFFLITCGERARDTGDGRWGRPRGILGETEGSRAPSWSDSDTLTHPIVHSRRHGWETSHETCERLRC